MGDLKLDREQEKAVARKIFHARKNRHKFQALRDAEAPGSLESAYRIQDEVDRLFQTEGGAGPMGGHKIALTSQVVQELCGVNQPAYGRVIAGTIRKSPAAVSLSDYGRLGLEFEVAVEMGQDIPAGKAAYDRDSIADYVAAVMTAFELIDDRDADYSTLDAASILTDRCWCGGVVLGEAVTDWSDLDLANAATELTWNGDVIDHGVAGDSMGHPFEGLAWIANHLISRGQTLRSGDVIITGSALKTQFPKAGDQASYRIEGLGTISVQVGA
jgi:2-keto-4-pentenoate hydratase